MNFVRLIIQTRLILLLPAITLSVAVLAGCKREEIRIYQVPKDKSAPVARNAEAPHALARVRWVLPKGWEEQSPARMRVASFSVTNAAGHEADISIIPLPGVVGNDLDVVNLWREQLQLSSLSEAEMQAQTQPVRIGEAEGRLFNMVSKESLIDNQHPMRIIVAMLAQDNTSWFFKMTGEDALVNSQKEVFTNFLQSISFQEEAVSGQRTIARRPVSTNVKKVPSPKAAGAPDWVVPASWKPQPLSAMRLASFLVEGEDGNADISVAVLEGEGGGVLANVNRWRQQQLSLPAINDAELAKLIARLDRADSRAMLFDMTGVDPKTRKRSRMVAAIVPKDGRTWFYKMMGDEQVVGREKEAFVKFVQTVKYPNAP